MSRTHKAPYTGSKRFDKTCRNHGSCPYCRDNRTFERAESLPENSLQYAEDEIDALVGIIDTVTDDDELEVAANPDVIIERANTVESIYNVSFAGMSRQQIGDTIREMQRKVRREQGLEP